MPTFYGLRITYIVPARHKSQPRAPQALLVTVVYLPQIVVLNDGNNRNMHSAGFEVLSCLHSALTCTSLRCMLAKFDLFSSPTSFACWKAFGNNMYWNIVLVSVCYVSLDLHSILMFYTPQCWQLEFVPRCPRAVSICVYAFFLQVFYIKYTDWNYSVFVYLTIFM